MAAKAKTKAKRWVLEVEALPAQERFWALSAKYRAYVGGVGAGKTFAGGVALLSMPARTRGMVIAPSYPVLRDATMQAFFDLCPPELVKSHNKTEKTTVLRDGKTIYWRSADNPNSLRGPNLSWLWGDEAAYFERASWKVGLGRLRVADRGPTRAWITTTPDGFNWVWEDFVQSPGPEHAHVVGKTRENIHNEQGYADRLGREYGQGTAFARQELEGEFTDTAGDSRLPSEWWTPATHLALAPNLVTPPQISWAQVRLYRLPGEGEACVIGADPAEGVGGDDSAWVVMSRVRGDVLAVGAGQWEPKEEFPEVLAQVSLVFGGAPVLCERNNHGHAVIAGLMRRGVRVLEGPDGREGWPESALNKAELYNAFAAELKAQAVFVPDARLKQQLASINRHTLRGPGKGKRTRVDDEAVACALANKARSMGGASNAGVLDLGW